MSTMINVVLADMVVFAAVIVISLTTWLLHVTHEITRVLWPSEKDRFALWWINAGTTSNTLVKFDPTHAQQMKYNLSGQNIF